MNREHTLLKASLEALSAKIGAVRSVLAPSAEATIGMLTAQKRLGALYLSDLAATAQPTETETNTLAAFTAKKREGLDNPNGVPIPGSSLHSALAYDAKAECNRALALLPGAGTYPELFRFLHHLEKFLHLMARLIDEDLNEQFY